MQTRVGTMTSSDDPKSESYRSRWRHPNDTGAKQAVSVVVTLKTDTVVEVSVSDKVTSMTDSGRKISVSVTMPSQRPTLLVNLSVSVIVMSLRPTLAFLFQCRSIWRQLDRHWYSTISVGRQASSARPWCEFQCRAYCPTLLSANSNVGDAVSARWPDFAGPYGPTLKASNVVVIRDDIIYNFITKK